MPKVIDLSRLKQGIADAGIQLPEGSNRMAMGNKFQEDLKQVLTPWESYQRQDYDPAYYGQSERGYARQGQEGLASVQNMLSDRKSDKDIMSTLQRDYGLDSREAQQTLVDIRQSRYDTLRPFTRGVPNAAGDEAISRFALEKSGFTNVSPMNEGSYFATDIKGNYDGVPVKIDAQQRMGRGGVLNLGVLNTVPQGGERIFNQARARGDTLLDVIRQLRGLGDSESAYKNSREDKLLQKDHVLGHFKPSDWITNRRIFNEVEKDAIITNLRSNFSGTPGFNRNQGPYNPEIPESIGYVDLEGVRERVMDAPLNRMREASGGMDVQFRPQYGKLSLAIPSRVVEELTTKSNKLDPDAIQAILRMA